MKRFLKLPLFLITLSFCMAGCNTMDKPKPIPREARILPQIESSPLQAPDPAAARALFDNALQLPLRQSWANPTEPGFQPGTVLFAAHDGKLVGFAQLDDREIGNTASSFNQRTWETGDIFEIFISLAGEPAYFEFHITPENQLTQLRWPEPGTLQREAEAGTLRHERYFHEEKIMTSRTWVEPDSGRWSLVFSLPLEKLKSSPDTPIHTISLSFCRYDRGADGKGVYSSATDFPFAGFHEIEYWPLYSMPQTHLP